MHGCTRIFSSLAIMATLSPLAAFAGTITMSATYYTIAETDQDENDLAGGVFDNEVQNSLGPNGLPVLNTSTYGCTSNCFTNMPFPADLTAGGEITWWSPSLNKGGAGGTSDVVQTGTGMITVPYNNQNFFPPNGTGTDDANGFQAAVFSATLHVPLSESISFNVGADDVAFVYLDGSIVCDLGGVHPNAAGTCTSSTLAPGDHTLDLYYADLHQVAASLTFDVLTGNVTTTPEPGCLALLAAGFGGLSLLWRRR
jgi:fibro-slime domain-containing protein